MWSANIVHFPHGADLNGADLNLAVNASFYALERAVGNVVAYNLLLITSFVLAAVCVWRLAARVSGSLAAGWLAGLLYAASGYWISSALNAWLYLVHIWVLPVVLLALERAGRTPRRRAKLALKSRARMSAT